MKRQALPKVSCIMVTADRPDMCQRAIRCYLKQTYENKEFVVLDNGVESMQHLLAEVPQKELRYLRVEKEPGMVIGGLRNTSLEEATGDIIVPQWDDDDWSHPERVERQVNVLIKEGKDACTLAGTLMHVDSTAYFDHPFIGLLKNGVPPTIAHWRDADIRYPDLRRTSDTAYVEQWRQREYAQLPKSESYLYIRYFHGGNLWEEDHFLRRMRNTPIDLLAYGWHKHVRGNVLNHKRFQLSEEAQAAFRMYLDDSFVYDFFLARSREEHLKQTAG